MCECTYACKYQYISTLYFELIDTLLAFTHTDSKLIGWLYMFKCQWNSRLVTRRQWWIHSSGHCWTKMTLGEAFCMSMRREGERERERELCEKERDSHRESKREREWMIKASVLVRKLQLAGCSWALEKPSARLHYEAFIVRSQQTLSSPLWTTLFFCFLQFRSPKSCTWILWFRRLQFAHCASTPEHCPVTSEPCQSPVDESKTYTHCPSLIDIARLCQSRLLIRWSISPSTVSAVKWSD